jgi:hypothetical protein
MEAQQQNTPSAMEKKLEFQEGRETESKVKYTYHSTLICSNSA